MGMVAVANTPTLDMLPITGLRPLEPNLASLPKALQEAGQLNWQSLNELHTIELPVEQQAPLQWLLAISPFIHRVLMAYGNGAACHLFSSAGLTKAQVLESVVATTTEAEVMQRIRYFRHLEMARIAATDLLGGMTVGEGLVANTNLAEWLIEAANVWAQLQVSKRYGQALCTAGNVQPLWVIAMGKLGGAELNFSSDIDLIFCYAESGETTGGRESVDHQIYFTKIAQLLVKLLGHVTADGKAFRVDLRLRPFGNAGPIVTSLAALEDYYQEQGRNWERYAMVKSRVLGRAANNNEGQLKFARLMRPFVYRRYLDYSAIDALRKMKLLINQESRRLGTKFNVKLGMGGIREVEFVAQVFQLIRGGREPEFQTRSLVEALRVAQTFGLLAKETVQQLLQGYAWLRKLEHVLQQIDDQQTQQLPSEEENQARVLAACGLASWPELISYFKQTTGVVHQAFLDVIGGEQEMMSADDSEFALLWQDLIDDATAIGVLKDAGAELPEQCWLRIRNFRDSIRRRSCGPRGRELLAILVPLLIEELVLRDNTNDVLQRVFDVIEQVVSRTTYLELLTGNKGARQQLVLLCEASPWVASLIARLPILLDELIDPQQLYDLPDPLTYQQEVAEQLNRLSHDDPEAQMEALRQVKQVFQLRIAAADLSNGVALMRVSDHLTYLAEAMTAQVVLMAWRQLAQRHGCPKGKDETDTGFAVIAYGKLGGYELGYGSDLDLVFLCEDNISGLTNGLKPIDAQQFYLRLAQRILHLFTTRSMHGVLYDVDMRLRPSGQSGLMVVRESTYATYLQNDAWTWELQALVRARQVFGSTVMGKRFIATRQQVLCQMRNKQQLQNEIVTMREKMRTQQASPEATVLDVKNMVGGMTDIEFMTQFLVLNYAAQHPSFVTYTDNIRILEAVAEANVLSLAEVTELVESYKSFRSESHRLSLAESEKESLKAFEQERAFIQRLWQKLLLQ